MSARERELMEEMEEEEEERRLDGMNGGALVFHCINGGQISYRSTRF